MNKTTRAFTLVELLVVIGIIALLIAILLPALNRARAQANQVACASNLRQMGLAMIMYNNDTGYYPGRGSLPSGETPPGNGNLPYAVWPTRLRKYMGNSNKPFYCPAESYDDVNWSTHVNTTETADLQETGFGYNQGEQLLVEDEIRFSYGYNDWGAYDDNGADAGGDVARPGIYKTNTACRQKGLGADLWKINNPPYTPTHYPCTELKASLVRKPVDMIMIADISPKPVAADQWNFNIDPRDPTQAPGTIHNGGANVLYGDAHVEWHPPVELMLLNPANVNIPLTVAQYAPIARHWNNDDQP